MSGYLQRMVLSVQKPAETIRPILGSVFAPPQTAGGWEAQNIETVVPGAFPQDDAAMTTRDQSQPAPVQDPNRRMPNPEPQSPRDSRPIRESLIAASEEGQSWPESERAERVTAGAKTPFKPLISDPREAETGDTRAGQAQSTGRLEPASATPTSAHREADEKPAPRREGRWEPTEVSPGKPGPAETSRPVSAVARPFSVDRVDRGRTSLRRPEAERREPDEIQIHIGRIEVSAAAPAALRPPAPKASPGAPSLAEYLRQRDGKPV